MKLTSEQFEDIIEKEEIERHEIKEMNHISCVDGELYNG